MGGWHNGKRGDGMDFSGKRYWMVGASEGLGRAVARKLSAAGAELILSARSGDRLHDLVGELEGAAEVLPMDVSDEGSVTEAADKLGQIDGLVWTVGAYWPMAAQEWDAGKAAKMCDVNFTGCVRVLGRIVPGMVDRGRGHVVLTGSVSGYRGLPGAIGYAASKAGVMALAECMECDLRGSGVKVQLANPGFIKTRLTDKNEFKMPMMMTPEDAADHMLRLMKSGRFSANFPRAFGALFRASQFLPDWLYYRIAG